MEEKDVNKNKDAFKELIKRGINKVPTFLIDDNVVIGLDIDKIDEFMNF